MWSQLLQKHHLSKKPFDPTAPRERYEIKESRRGNNSPMPPPRSHKHKEEPLFVLKSRKEKEKTIRKTFSVFLQLALFLQFAILLPLLTAAGLFKLGWRDGIMGVPENWNNSTTPSRCQFEMMGESYESNTTYNWEAIQAFVDGIGNCLIGFLFMVLSITMLTLLYIRANNIFPMIILVAAWTLFAITMKRNLFLDNFLYYFGLSGDAMWITNTHETLTTGTPANISTTGTPSLSSEEYDNLNH